MIYLQNESYVGLHEGVGNVIPLLLVVVVAPHETHDDNHQHHRETDESGQHNEEHFPGVVGEVQVLLQRVPLQLSLLPDGEHGVDD